MNNDNFEIVFKKLNNIDVLISQIGTNMVDLNKRLVRIEKELKADRYYIVENNNIYKGKNI